MSDFIYSKNRQKVGDLLDAVECIHHTYVSRVREIHGKYGSIAYVKNHYNGFDMYENNSYICIVIGGPVLNFCVNDFISVKDSNCGTKAIFERWIIEGSIVWDNDLSGPFVVYCLNKESGDVKLVTDMMSFVPVYIYDKDSFLVGTHIDSLNRIVESSLDEVSVVDYLLNEVVTFPYTLWHDIKQLYPGSIYQWENLTNESNTEVYWKPNESAYSEIDQNILAKEIREGLFDFVGRVEESTSNISCFISGGEDSRSVLSALSGGKDALIFVDEENRESAIAENVCDLLEANMVLGKRGKYHYLHILEEASDLIGSGFDYAHVHTIGFIEKLGLLNYDAVFGGFLADTLLKGHHIQKRAFPNILSFLPIPEKISDKHVFFSGNPQSFKKDVVRDVTERKERHLSFVKGIRPESYKEWINIYPITMHNDIPNIHGNRRLFRSYEPFTGNRIVKVAAIASQKQKMDKKLFYKAFRSIYQKTKYIRHANGSYPYLPWYFNRMFKFQYSLYKKLVLSFVAKNTNQGSWVDWSTIIDSENANSIERKYFALLKSTIQPLLTEEIADSFLKVEYLSVRQKRIILQLGYVLSRNRRV